MLDKDNGAQNNVSKKRKQERLGGEDEVHRDSSDGTTYFRWSGVSENFIKAHCRIQDRVAWKLFCARFDCSITLLAYKKKRRALGIKKEEI